MRTLRQHSTALYTVLLAAFAFAACDYNTFDNPAPEESPALSPTHTLAQLKAMYTNRPTAISSEVIVEGTVISSDREGNVYKALMIQDASGGIEIKVNRTGIYNFYKIGQKVWLKCNGLVLGTYGQSLDIGMEATDPSYETDFIDTRMLDDFLVKGPQGEVPAPQLITLTSKPSTRLDNTWIRLENVQFLTSELNLNWADAANKVTQNRTLQDKNGKTIVVRTSGYARFAGSRLPQGSGSVNAILSFFNGTPQLTVVSLADVQLDGPRF